MDRQSLAGGAWFDYQKAEKFTERMEADDDGEPVSLATGSSAEHEELFRTRHGSYVLRHWSMDPNAPTTLNQIDILAAAAWLVRNGYEPPVEGPLAVAVAVLEV